jgi:hypothetical protein
VAGAEGEGDGDTNRGSYAMPLSRLAVKFGSGILLDDLFSGHWVDCPWRDDPWRPVTKSSNTPPDARFKHCEDAYFPGPPHVGSSLAREKIGRFLRRPTQVCPQLSAHVGDALLDICLGRGHWLRRQLQHCCRLTLAQDRQQHGPPIRKFERIVMCGQLVLVDLSKDCRLVVDCLRLPPDSASRQARNFPGEGQLRSWQHTPPVRDHPRRRTRVFPSRSRTL